MELSGKKCPVGTQRYWESTGLYWVKTHDNTIFDDYVGAWITVPNTPSDFSNLFSNLNTLGSKITKYKEPVEGDVWLTKVLDEFKTTSGKKFPSRNFKRFSGKWKNSSDVSYNFKWELEYKLHQSELERNEFIAENLLRRNEDVRTEKLSKGETAPEGKIYLEKEEIKELRKKFKEDYKSNIDPLSLQDVEELTNEVKKILDYLERGENFEGDEKVAYDEISSILSEIQSGPYQKLNIISQKRKRINELLDTVFKSNFGISQTVRKRLEGYYSSYIKKYSNEIKEDSIKDFEKEIDCSIFEEYSPTFYSKLQSSRFGKFKETKLENFEGKLIPHDFQIIHYTSSHESEEIFGDKRLSYDGTNFIISYRTSDGSGYRQIVPNYRLNELLRSFKRTTEDVSQEDADLFDIAMKVRFDKLYSKSFEGEYNPSMIGFFKTLENTFNYLPKGHLQTNDKIQRFKRQTISGPDYESYAHHDSGQSEIYFSDKALKYSSISGDIFSGDELGSVLIHEIGHGVTTKLGRRNSRSYKDFVVECGWSWEQFQVGDTSSNYIATGDDKDIPRVGRNSQIPLLTEYAHKSPEEAFAEYYSVYSQYKKKIDHYLETGDDSKLKDKSYFSDNGKGAKKSYFESSKGQDFKVTSDLEYKFSNIQQQLRDYNRSETDHIQTSLLSPLKDLKYHSDSGNKLDNYKMAYYLKEGRKNEYPEPIFTLVTNKGEHYIPQETKEREIYSHFSNKYLGRTTPTYSMTEECYNILKKAGFQHEDIENYTFNKCKDSKIVSSKNSVIVNEKGLQYRHSVIPVSTLTKSKNIFKKMKEIWESEELKKSLEEMGIVHEVEEIEKSTSLTTLFHYFTQRIKDYFSTSKESIKTEKDNEVQSREYGDSLVFNQFGQLLILQRTKLDDFEPEKWSLPGGKIEEGESYLEGTVRELQEETNIVINPFYFPNEENYIKCSNDDNSTSYYYCFCINSSELSIVLDVEEHQDYKWIFPEDIENYDFLLNLRERLVLLLQEFTVPGLMDYSLDYNEEQDYKILTPEEYNSEIDNSFNKGLINDDNYLILKSSFQQGKLIKVERIDKNGKKVSKWIKPEEVENDKKENKDYSKVQSQSSKKEHSKKELSVFAKNTSEVVLKKVIQESPNPKHREAAHIELDRRKGREEVTPTTKDKNIVGVESTKLFNLLRDKKFRKLDRKKQVQLIESSNKSVEDTNKKLSLLFEASDKELDDLDTYCSISYKEINQNLRDGAPLNPRLNKVVNSIDKTISRNKLEEDIVVYRGISGDDSNFNSKAFTSTSIEPYTAYNFARGDNPSIKSYKIPKGTNYAYIGGGEKELVLPRDFDIKQFEIK